MKAIPYMYMVAAGLLSLGLWMPVAHATQARGPLGVEVPVLPLRLNLQTPTLGVGSSSMLAQATPEAPPSVSETSTRPELEAAALLRLGLIQLTEGQMEGARKVFEKVLLVYPGTAAANTAANRLLELKAVQAQSPQGTSQQGSVPAATPSSRATKANGGKAEFIVTETLLGGYAGFLVGDILAMGGKNTSVLLPMTGLGLGLGASLLASNLNEISSAEAMQLRSIQILSTFNIAAWANALSNGFLEPEAFAGMQLLGLAVGTGLGALSLEPIKLTEGQVAFVTSAGVWAPLLGMMTHGSLLRFGLTAGQLNYILPSAADLGVAAAMLLSQSGLVKLSRGRMMLINLGGCLGMTLAGALLSAGQNGSSQGNFRGLLLGSIAGLGLGVLATSTWDATYNPEVLARSESPTVLTVEDGRVKLGRLLPQVRPEVRITQGEDQIQRTTGMTVHMGLLGGAF